MTTKLPPGVSLGTNTKAGAALSTSEWPDEFTPDVTQTSGVGDVETVDQQRKVTKRNAD